MQWGSKRSPKTVIAYSSDLSIDFNICKQHNILLPTEDNRETYILTSLVFVLQQMIIFSESWQRYFLPTKKQHTQPPSCPNFCFQNHAVFRQFWANFGLRLPPWGQNLCWAPDQFPGSAPVNASIVTCTGGGALHWMNMEAIHHLGTWHIDLRDKCWIASAACIKGADPGIWSGGGPVEFWRGGAWAQNLRKIGFLPIKLPEKCMILKKSWGQGGRAPRPSWIRYWYQQGIS